MLNADGHRRSYHRQTARRMTVAEAAYMAGIIDGEGSLFIYRNRNRIKPELAVANTSKPLIDWLHSFCGMAGPWQVKTARLGKRKQWVWRVRRVRDVLYLLEMMRPYLLVKDTKADEVMDQLREWLA